MIIQKLNGTLPLRLDSVMLSTSIKPFIAEREAYYVIIENNNVKVMSVMRNYGNHNKLHQYNNQCRIIMHYDLRTGENLYSLINDEDDLDAMSHVSYYLGCDIRDSLAGSTTVDVIDNVRQEVMIDALLQMIRCIQGKEYLDSDALNKALIDRGRKPLGKWHQNYLGGITFEERTAKDERVDLTIHGCERLLSEIWES